MPFLILLLTFSLGVLAAERPKLPPRGIDHVLVGDSLDEFHEKRQKDLVCQTELTAKREAMEGAKAKLEAARKGTDKAAILAAHQELLEKRREFFVPFRKCGECAVHPVIPLDPIKGDGGWENWYVSDGSCVVREADAESAKTNFHKRATSLLDVAQYPNKRGGFRNVIEFLAVDRESGELSPKGLITPGDFSSFVAVKCPLELPFVLWYFFKNTTQQLHPDDQDFLLTFNWEAPPEGYQLPKLFDITPTGEKKTYFPHAINAAMGHWYLKHVNNKVYLRYFTAADFGALASLAEKIAPPEAELILLETLYELSQRFR